MGLFELSQTGGAVLTLVIVGVMFAMFLREQYPTEVVALAGVSVMLISGVLPYEAARLVFANPAPWTIAAMFIVMGALVRTGAHKACVGDCYVDGLCHLCQRHR